MKTLILAIFLFNTAYAHVNQVYGTDDREDINEISDPLIQKLAQSTAAMFNREMIEQTDNGYELYYKTLGEAQNMCHGERFFSQPASSKCSGFLIAPNIIMTAGHCLIAEVVSADILNPRPRPYRDPMDINGPYDIDLDDILNPPNLPSTPRYSGPAQDSQEFMDMVAKQGCQKRSWIFDYNYLGKKDATVLSSNSVYHCKKVLKVRYSEKHTDDYAIVELDRAVRYANGQKRQTLSLDLHSAREIDSPVFMIGYPAGLPAKYTNNARILKKENQDQLKVVIDSFGGNSGSAIFDQMSKRIIGILIRGHNDYYHVDTAQRDRFGFKKQCKKVYVCDDENNSRCNGEIVYNLRNLPKAVKQILIEKRR